jgi:CheY-like chemotaxis protein
MKITSQGSAASGRVHLQRSPQPVLLPNFLDDVARGAERRHTAASDLPHRLAAVEEPAERGGLLVPLHGVHVMVVEDNADARNIIRRVLEHCGAIVTVMESASPALRRLRTMVTRPNVLVSDLALPGDDGYWLIGQVRALERLRTLPAIAITAHRNEYDREATLATGFQEYFQKPLDLVSFSRAVARLAGR